MIRRGIERIKEIDERYVLLEFTPGKAHERDVLRIIRRRRSTGVSVVDAA